MENLMESFALTASKIKEFTEYLGDTNGQSFMEVVRDLLKFNPFDGNKFYIFSFIKLKDMQRFHQPRLTKPEPVPGSTLVHVDPKNPEYMKMCWTLPPEESFDLFKDKKLFADQFVWECINTYKKYPRQLMRAEPGDLTEDQMRDLYKDLKKKIDRVKQAEKLSKAK
jgi:hypothetical protein